MIKQNIWITTLILIILGCTRVKDNNQKKPTINIDTIEVKTIYGELLKSNKSRVELSYFDRNKNVANGLVSGEKCYLNLSLNVDLSKKFKKKTELFLIPVSKNFKVFYDPSINSKLKMIGVLIDPDADTVVFDVFLKFDNTVFKNVTTNEKGEEKIEILNELVLCRKLELPG